MTTFNESQGDGDSGFKLPVPPVEAAPADATVSMATSAEILGAPGRATRAPAGEVRPTASIPPDAGPHEPAPPETAVAPEEAIQAMFRSDQNVRATMAENLRARTGASGLVVRRAKGALAGFTASRYSAAERAKSSYLAPGDHLPTAMQATMNDGLAAMRSSTVDRSLRLALDDGLAARLRGARDGTVDLKALIEHMRHAPGTWSGKRPDAYTLCQAELEAERRLAAAERSTPPGPTPNGYTGQASVNGGLDVATSDATDALARAARLVEFQVGQQMASATSPETRLRYAVPEPADQAERARSIDTFELRDGPSDVTAYHDFSSLRIAFQPVWTEIFDGQLKAMGEKLYEQYVRLKEAAGGDDGKDYAIGDKTDLDWLVEASQSFARSMKKDVPKGIWGWIQGVPGVADLLGYGDEEDLTGSKTRDPQDADRLEELLAGLRKLMAEPFAFDIFAKDSINFGFIVTYRQTWTPQSYQVGDLVSTIPLAPRETRRYTTRRVSKTRAVKELEDNLSTRRTDTHDTDRVDKEIVDKAHWKSNYNLNTHESFGGDGYQIDATQNFGGDEGKQSERTKKDFRENVLKSAQEYKAQHRTEIDTTETTETEETTFHELQNPNDELTVTYLFYELQRTYRIRERIHKLTPVILVANEMPAPHDIDDTWLTRYDWILRRVILDDSFRPALRYLTESFVGAEVNIRILQENVKAQRQVVETLRQQVQAQDRLLDADERAVQAAVRDIANKQQVQGVVDVVKGFFDPLGITQKTDTGVVNAAEAMADYAKETRDRAERERQRLASQLEVAISALQAATDRLSAAVKEHRNKLAEIDRLRVHVKENILHYMQAIWRNEPPDQRYFRLYNLDVPIISIDPNAVSVEAQAIVSAVEALQPGAGAAVKLPPPVPSVQTKKLFEVAELDAVLGYKGNYSIFALKENHYITLHMMQDYLDVGEELGVRDPDQAGDLSLDELQRLAQCLAGRDPAEFARRREELKRLLLNRLTSSRPDDDLVVVPTSSLYIEALVGTHPLLEDFKLIHRALDVKKVQAEVRHTELENIRLAARALRAEDEDPDIERKIVVEGAGPQWTVQPDVN